MVRAWVNIKNHSDLFDDINDRILPLPEIHLIGAVRQCTMIWTNHLSAWWWIKGSAFPIAVSTLSLFT